MRKVKVFFLLPILILLTFVELAQSAIIQLKSGETVEGKIVIQTPEFIKLDANAGVNISYYSDDIDNIDGVPFEAFIRGKKDSLISTPSAIEQVRMISLAGVEVEKVYEGEGPSKHLIIEGQLQDETAKESFRLISDYVNMLKQHVSGGTSVDLLKVSPIGGVDSGVAEFVIQLDYN